MVLRAGGNQPAVNSCYCEIKRKGKKKKKSCIREEVLIIDNFPSGADIRTGQHSVKAF